MVFLDECRPSREICTCDLAFEDDIEPLDNSFLEQLKGQYAWVKDNCSDCVLDRGATKFEVLQHDFGVPQHDFGVPQHDFGVPQHDFQVLQHDFQVLQHDFEVPQHDFEVPQHDFGVPQHDFGVPQHDFEISVAYIAVLNQTRRI